MQTKKNYVGWPKTGPKLTAEQEKAREAFMLLWHQELPNKYALIEQFNHGYVAQLSLPTPCYTLEIGAGIGGHAKFEKLNKQEYYVMEYREEFCKTLKTIFPPDRVQCGDIQVQQPWPEKFFDRIIAIHVLEHLPNLPAALEEIDRLLKPGGTFDVVIPCEGEPLYSLARRISSKRLFEKNFHMDFTPIIRNEHLSTCTEIMELLAERFHITQHKYFPFLIPLAAINLCIGMRLTKK